MLNGFTRSDKIPEPPSSRSSTFGEKRTTVENVTKSHSKRGCCRYCHGRKFIRSSVRSRSDVLALLRLHYPVRCRRCSKRQYVDLLTASRALSAASRGNLHSKADDNWCAWTSGSDITVLESLKMKNDQ